MIDPSMMQGPPPGPPQGGGLPPELMAALAQAGQQQGAPPQDPTAGLPPELIAMLSGQGGPPPGMAPPGADPNAPPDGQDPGQQPDFYTSLSAALDALKSASGGAPDAQDAHAVDKLVAGLTKILATHEKEHQKSMGGNVDQMRSMSRAYGG